MVDIGADAGQGPDILQRLAGRRHVLLLLGGALFVLALVVGYPFLSLCFLVASLLLALAALALRRLPQVDTAFAGAAELSIRAVAERDGAAVLIVDEEGEVLYGNATALRDLGTDRLCSIDAVLGERVGNVGAAIDRLRIAARRDGYAREDIATAMGHSRLSVLLLEEGRYCWRLEEFGRQRGDTELDERVPVISIGRGQAILYMNAAARRLVGRRPKRLEELFADPVWQAEDAPVQIRTATGIEVRRLTTLEGLDGRRDILLLPVPEENTLSGQAPTIWNLVDGLPVPILRLSVEGQIELANAAACQLLKIGPDSGQNLGDLMEGLGRSIPEWLAGTVDPTRDDALKPQAEFLRLSRSEREIFVQVAVKPVRHDNEISLVAVLSDATELKTLEAQFVQTQKMQAIGQLAGGVAHDFNNLLTAISGHCDLLLLRHDAGDPDYGDLVQINQNTNRAAALVGQLLAFSRKQTLRPETLDLRDTLSDLTHLLNRLVGERVALSFDHEAALPQIRADKRQLEQVLMNLVVNARDAMPNGGEIRISTQILELAEEMQRDRAVVPAGEYVSVRVTDTGVGIPPDKLGKVFEPFFTTKRVGEGTGLGLSTAYGIVKQSGGFIFVESTQGVGTCFTLLFPAQRHFDQLPVVAAKLPDIRSEAGGDGIVLLVEDEAPVRAFASRALRLRGYTVLEAESGEQALDTLRSSRLPIDVFVTDVIMPGLDGPSWVREALKERPGVRVIFVSGYAEDSFGESAARIPNSVFLPKPFSLAQLTETVQSQIALGKAADDPQHIPS